PPCPPLPALYGLPSLPPPQFAADTTKVRATSARAIAAPENVFFICSSLSVNAALGGFRLLSEERTRTVIPSNVRCRNNGKKGLRGFARCALHGGGKGVDDEQLRSYHGTTSPDRDFAAL